MSKKVTVIGAGNVGATVANVLAGKNIVGDIVLLDIKPGLAEGKALDIWESSHINYFDTRVHGYTDDYSKTANSDVVVITSGLPRKPGMSRDDLIGTNAKIVKSVAEKAYEYSPDAIYIVVSNPLDVMTYTAYLTTGLPRERVFGMAGVLDTGRFEAFIAEALHVSPKDVTALLMGGHGDTMVPLLRYSSVAGIPLPSLVDMGWTTHERLQEIVQRTRDGGAEVVKLLKTGSAFYAPASSAIQMAESYLRDQKRILPSAAYFSGEYGVKDLYVGVPCLIGGNGVEKIIEMKLNDEERAMFEHSVEAVRGLVEACRQIDSTLS